MRKSYKIFLIEDCLEHANETIRILNNAAGKYAEEYEFKFEWLQGTSEPEDVEHEKHIFYDSEIVGRLAEKIKEGKSKGECTGILLDIMLTKEDIEKTLKSYYAYASISRDIYYRFNREIPIYIISTSSSFGGQSSVIMGTDLSNQFVKYGDLKKTYCKEDTDRLFSYYQDYYETKEQHAGERELAGCEA